MASRGSTPRQGLRVRSVRAHPRLKTDDDETTADDRGTDGYREARRASAMTGYSPADLPDETALDIRWDRDATGSGQDPKAIGITIGRWEWKSVQKRTETEWNVDGTEVHLHRGKDGPGVEFETAGGEVEVLHVYLTDEEYRTLREHKSVQFEDSRTFPFDATVVRRE